MNNISLQKDICFNTLKIKDLSYLDTVIILILVQLYSILFFIPFDLVSIVLRKFSLYWVSSYINIIGEFAVYCIIINNLIRKYSINNNIPRQKEILQSINFPQKKAILFIITIISSYILFYNNSIIFLLQNIELSKTIQYHFKELFSNYLTAFISLTIIAPLFEEIIFRGIILEGLLKRYNVLISLLFSSLIFGIAHLNILQGINAFFISLIIGFIYVKTKSILLCILAHSINNGIIFFYTVIKLNIEHEIPFYLRIGISILSITTIIICLKNYKKFLILSSQ